MTIIQWEGVTNISKQLNFKITFCFYICQIFFFAACNLDAQFCLQSPEDIFDQYDFSEEDFSIDFIALALLYIAFNVLAFLFLWLRVRKN